MFLKVIIFLCSLAIGIIPSYCMDKEQLITFPKAAELKNCLEERRLGHLIKNTVVIETFAETTMPKNHIDLAIIDIILEYEDFLGKSHEAKELYEKITQTLREIIGEYANITPQ